MPLMTGPRYVSRLSRQYRSLNIFKPCTSGVCSWDIPATDGGASGTVKIVSSVSCQSYFSYSQRKKWGAETAISDITTAGGWEILGCSPSALEQDIRLVCTGDESDCEHLYSGHGAVDTLVRLPESVRLSRVVRLSKVECWYIVWSRPFRPSRQRVGPRRPVPTRRHRGPLCS
jgi:hypothetical protein